MSLIRGGWVEACPAAAFPTSALVVIEEPYLPQNLSGCDEYAQRVRARLIPGLL